MPRMPFSRWAAVAAMAVGLGLAPALAQDEADSLRASKLAGEQSDGYLGSPPSVSVPPEMAAKVRQINIQRRAFYTRVAGEKGATVQEVGVATACELLRSKVDPGEWYRTEAGEWRQRQGSEPVPLPGACAP